MITVKVYSTVACWESTFNKKMVPLRPQSGVPSDLKKYVKIVISWFCVPENSFSRGAHAILALQPACQ